MMNTLVIDLSDEEREALKAFVPVVQKHELANHIPLMSGVELGHFEFRVDQRKSWEQVMCDAFDLFEDKKVARAVHALGERIGKTSLVQFTDLRDVSDHTDRCVTTVFIADNEEEPDDDRPRKKWLVFGSCNVRLDISPMRLEGYLKGNVTDPEHDAALVLRLPLIGVKLHMIHGHATVLEAWVAPRSVDEFHVPWPGYDPVKREDTQMCDYERCEEPHPIVDWDYYVPPTEKELYEYVAGRKVMIRIGTVRPKGEDDE